MDLGVRTSLISWIVSFLTECSLVLVTDSNKIESKNKKNDLFQCSDAKRITCNYTLPHILPLILTLVSKFTPFIYFNLLTICLAPLISGHYAWFHYIVKSEFSRKCTGQPCSFCVSSTCSLYDIDSSTVWRSGKTIEYVNN